LLFARLHHFFSPFSFAICDCWFLRFTPHATDQIRRQGTRILKKYFKRRNIETLQPFTGIDFDRHGGRSYRITVEPASLPAALKAFLLDIPVNHYETFFRDSRRNLALKV